jgi:glycosyltransferase involved in cell wall biosynthesis
MTSSSSPRLTVAICFHNEEGHLAQAIRSILHQSFSDFELLLIDDGSSDGSVAIARSFSDNDSRVRLFVDHRHEFLAGRLNQAMREARGELFARMDGDDVSHPERLALQVAHLEQHSTCVAVGTWAGLIDETEEPFGVIEAPTNEARSARSILERGVIPHATMVARTSWLREHPYDASFTRAEDRDLWCRIDRSTRVDILADVLYVIRVLAGRPGFMSDYLDGQSDLRRVIRRYGPSVIGVTATQQLVWSSLLKSRVMHAAHILGLSRRLVRRRGRQPAPTELARVHQALTSSQRP